jgi:energy-coupling factor transport system permease protein
MTALTLAALQCIFVDTGPVWAELGPVTLTRDGVEVGVYVAGRFLCVVLLSYLFVLTTEPNDLAYALMKAGLPYRYGFALITALRLVPVFEDEGQIVYEAQLARGLRYDTGGPARYLRLARQYVLPLLVSALGKVDALAVSMEGRCFGKYPRRTFLRDVRVTRADVVALTLLGVSIVAFIVI